MSQEESKDPSINKNTQNVVDKQYCINLTETDMQTDTEMEFGAQGQIQVDQLS